MSILDRIKEVAQSKGISIADIERDLGISNKAIYRWNQSEPSISKVVAVAHYLDVSLEWLATGEAGVKPAKHPILQQYESLSTENKRKLESFLEIATLQVSNHTDPNDDNHLKLFQEGSNEYKKKKKVPLLGKVAAGIPITLVEEYLDQVLAPSTKVNFATVAKGESMEPVIHNRETIFVQSMTALDNGTIGIFDIDGETTCKVFKYDYKNKTVILTSFNDAFNPLTYPLKKYQNTFRIVGKVILTDEQEERYHNFISK